MPEHRAVRQHISSICSCALILTSAGAADWPHLRGPNYDGVSHERALADSWPTNGPPVLWTRELGQGHSGFIVAEGRCYTQYQNARGQFLLCLDPDTGATIWETRYDSGWQAKGAYPGPYATPTWAEGKIFCSSPTGRICCFDARDGSSFWSLDIHERFHGRGFEFGYAATPLVEDGQVIVPAGGPEASLVALSPDDGHTIWASGGDPTSYCSAFPIKAAGRRLIAAYLQNCFVLVDAGSGRQLFRQSFSSGYDEHSAWPIYRDPDLMLASPFRQPATQWRVQVGPDDEVKCPTRWVSPEFSNDIVSSVLYRDHIFGFDLKQLQASPHRPSRGTFKCLEWATGKVCWSTDRVGQASVLAADDKLYLLSDTGNLILARADLSAYHEPARVSLFEDEMSWTPPTLSQGRLYVRSPSRAICLFVGRPEDVPKNRVTQTLHHRSSPWRLDSGWLLSRERDYPNDAPTMEEMEPWYGTSLVCLTVAALGAGVVATSMRWLFARGVPVYSLFLGLALVLCSLGPNLFSPLLDRCLFTWPAALYCVFQATALAYSRVANGSSNRFAFWLARAMLVGFLLVIWGYFEICKRTGMFIGWSFLLGFPVAFPLTVLVCRLQAKRQSAWIGAIGTIMAFSLFFWSAAAVFWWKSRIP
jgi:outer membrane protein assembly factor BamB